MLYYLSTRIVLILVVCIASSKCKICLSNDDKDAYFYQLVPYISATKNTVEWKGIVPDILKNIKKYCNTDIQLTNETGANGNIEDDIENINGSFIITLQTKASKQFLEKYQLYEVPLFKSPGMVTIVPRYRISLWYKLMEGVVEVRYLFLVAILIIVIYGVLFWLSERNSDEDMDNGYKGALSGMWLGVVIMTSGFGDAPRTFLGKLLTAVCVIIGLLFLSLLTGSLISVVTNTDSLSIKDKQIVVKNLTTEQWLLENKFNAKTIVKPTYEQVIEHISNPKNSDTFAAVVEENVARFMTDFVDKNQHNHELSLAIVEETKIEIPIYILIPKIIHYSEQVRKVKSNLFGVEITTKEIVTKNDGGICIRDCIQTESKRLVDFNFVKYERPITFEKVSLSLNLREIFTDDLPTIYLTGIAGLMLLGVAGIAIYAALRRRQSGERIVEIKSVELGQVNASHSGATLRFSDGNSVATAAVDQRKNTGNETNAAGTQSGIRESQSEHVKEVIMQHILSNMLSHVNDKKQWVDLLNKTK